MRSQEWVVEFYESVPRQGQRKGTVPVEVLIRSFTAKSQTQVIKKLELLAARAPNLRKPHVKRVQGDILELRLRPEGTPYRILFFYPQYGRIVLLHGFKKSTRKTPKKEIKVAKSRMEDYLRRYQ